MSHYLLLYFSTAIKKSMYLFSRKIFLQFFPAAQVFRKLYYVYICFLRLVTDIFLNSALFSRNFNHLCFEIKINLHFVLIARSYELYWYVHGKCIRFKIYFTLSHLFLLYCNRCSSVLSICMSLYILLGFLTVIIYIYLRNCTQ